MSVQARCAQFHGCFIADRILVSNEISLVNVRIPRIDNVRVISRMNSEFVQFYIETRVSFMDVHLESPSHGLAPCLFYLFDGSSIPNWIGASFRYFPKFAKHAIEQLHGRKLLGEWVSRREWVNSSYCKQLFPGVELQTLDLDSNADRQLMFVGCLVLDALMMQEIARRDYTLDLSVQYRVLNRKKVLSANRTLYSWSFPLDTCLKPPSEFACDVGMSRPILSLNSRTHAVPSFRQGVGTSALVVLQGAQLLRPRSSFLSRRKEASRVTLAVCVGTRPAPRLAEPFILVLAILFFTGIVWSFYARVEQGPLGDPVVRAR